MATPSNPKHRTLGSILLEKGWVAESDLTKAIQAQDKVRRQGKEPPRLGDLLVHNKCLSAEKLQAALKLQRVTGQGAPSVISTSVELEERYGVLAIQLKNRLTQAEYVPESVSRHVLVTEDRQGEPVILATPIAKTTHVNALRGILNEVRAAYSDGRDDAKPAKASVVTVSPDLIVLKLGKAVGTGGRDDEVMTDAEKEFEKLVKLAYEQKAVDLHFFRGSDVCRIRFRIFGALRDYTEWDVSKADQVIQVGYTSFGSGGVDPYWKSTIRQRIRMKIEVNAHVTLDCRYEHAPGDDGAYHACIRILANDKREKNTLIDLENLGFTRAQKRVLEAGASKSSGMVILSGPTGSGKSTTLAAMVKWLNRNDDVNILTVESPIERELPAFQTSVSDNSDNPMEFAEAIKSTLRRDPDHLMVGEIRDKYSAQAAVTGVQTGHGLLTTVHAQSAIEIVERLASPALEIPPQTIGSPSLVNVLVFQMLLPKLDPNSKIRITSENMRQHLTPDLIERLLHVCPDLSKANICVRGSSPEYPEGISGMTICAEVVMPDLIMRRYFAKLELADALIHWRKAASNEMKKPYSERVSGFSSFDHAVSKMLMGEIDPTDVENYFGNIAMQDGVGEGAIGSPIPSLDKDQTEDDEDGFAASPRSRTAVETEVLN